jgi:hypothetical protein
VSEKGRGLTFSDLFLEMTDDNAPIEHRAKNGILHSRLSHVDLARLIVGEDGDRGSLDDVSERLRQACFTGELRATLPVKERRQSDNSVFSKVTVYYVHRDEARRYFQKLGLDVSQQIGLSCWLRGCREGEIKRLRPDQQDKADFQKLCLDIWERNPTMTITGASGVTMQPAETQPYLKHYTRKKLVEWAREVAPDGVKNKRGRPRKNIQQAEK